MIPVKIVVLGDQDRGRSFIGFAKDQMRILENLMSFQGLKQDYRTVKPYPDIVVECWSSFSQQVIKIHALPSVSKGGELVKLKKTNTYCPCFPHFSFGIIRSITPPFPTEESTEEDISDYKDFLKSGVNSYYDVELCDSQKYTLYENVISTGWDRCYPGQYVLVSMAEEDPFDEDEFDCGRKCLLDDIEFTHLVVTSLGAIGQMQEWLFEIIEE